MKRITCVPLLCAVLAFGCKDREAKAVVTTAPTEAKSIEAKPATDARAIALAKPSAKEGEAGANVLIETAQRALEKNPRKADWWIVLGRAWVRKARESSDPGFHLNAKAAADVALELEPGNKIALGLVGIVLLSDHKFDDARALAEKIIAADAEDPHAYGVLSDALLELGRYEEATTAAQKMVDLKPNLPSYSRVSYLQWIAGDVRAARESVRVAIDSGRDRKDPEPEAWTLVQAATMFWHQGDLDGADAGFDKASEWVRDYPPALVGKGRVALARGQAKRAAELFARAYDRSPLVETAWLLGDAHEAAGDSEAAARAFALVEKTGRASDPRSLSLFLSTKNKNPSLALELATAEAKARGDIATLDALAWALYRSGNIGGAKSAIDRARRFGTKEAQLVYHQGAIAIAAGELAAGRKLVAEALAMNPHFDETGAREARRLLEATESRVAGR